MDYILKYLTHLLPVLTLMVAIGVAGLAYQQYQLGRAKLKLDLFEKRLLVFNETQKLLNANVTDKPEGLERVYQFRIATSQSPFLFDSDIIDLLEEIDNRSVDHLAIVQRMDSPSSDSHLDSLIDKNAHAETWFKDQLRDLNFKFGPYLNLRTWR